MHSPAHRQELTNQRSPSAPKLGGGVRMVLRSQFWIGLNSEGYEHA